MPDLLIELFSEEIPARMQAKASDDLKKLVTDGLVEAGLTYASAAGFATPRRLCLSVEQVVGHSPTLRQERKGPRTDAPEKALDGFLRSTGLSKDQLEVRDDKKGQVYFAIVETAGRPAAEIVAEVLETTIRNFPWPKSMRWGAGALRWVRPLHSILCILSDEEGAQVVPMDVDGIVSGDTTEGHRFMGAGRFAVTGFEDYAAKLEANKVVLDPAERARRVEADAQTLAFARGVQVVPDAGLLAEVAGLVEWPVALMGDIGAEFLDLPAEVLQSSMREHQKFFSVRNPKTDRIEHYVTVANRETVDDGATILAGNGKVLAARLADAKFFWDNDLREAKKGGQAWLDKLKSVTFHNKLGTVADQVDRIATLSAEIAPLVGADGATAQQAARFAKADLSSEMVYEFPELQGVMGRYYAEKAGLSGEIGAVAQEHYSPLGPNDDVPSAPVSVAVALAEKIDRLTCFWAIEEKPTGSKDPFALRRAALGVIRLILENDTRFGLGDVLAKGHAGADVQDLMAFFNDRLKVHLKGEGIRHDVLDAAYALGGQDDLVLLVHRVRALQEFLGSDDGANLVQGYKRATNILTAEEKKDGVSYELEPELKFAEEDAEKALFAALDGADAKLGEALKSEDFAAAMQTLATLRAPIDGFFDGVQVNSDNQVVRRNRLCLLGRIRDVMHKIAIFSEIEG